MKNEEKKLSLKEKMKDKRERAKIELILYGIFFVGVIIFTRIIGNSSNHQEDINNASFVYSIKDNYEYAMVITIDNREYEYYGKVLGNNSTINFKTDEEEHTYYLAKNKYYVLEDNNYILTDEKEVYPYIDYRYLNIDNIKEYLNIAIKEGNIYKVKLSDIILNSDNDNYITIYIEEGDKNIIIDYTSLFKLFDKDIEKLIVNISYYNVNNILSLEE